MLNPLIIPFEQGKIPIFLANVTLENNSEC